MNELHKLEIVIKRGNWEHNFDMSYINDVSPREMVAILSDALGGEFSHNSNTERYKKSLANNEGLQPADRLELIEARLMELLKWKDEMELEQEND